MQTQTTANARSTSREVLYGASGSIVTVSPSSGGYAFAQYTTSGDAAIRNGSAVWNTWARGAVSTETADTMLQNAAVRLVCVSGTATMTISAGTAVPVIDQDLVFMNQRRKSTLQPSNRMIVIGDSIAADFYVDTGTSTAFMQFGFATWVNALLGSRFQIVNPTAAQGGTTSRTWVGRVETEVVPYNPSWVLCYLGTNDISSDIPFEETTGNLQKIWDRIIGLGAQLCVCTVLPYGAGSVNLTPARNVARNRLNTWICDYVSRTQGAVLADTFSVVIDPASTVGAARADYLHDDLHPSPVGARAMGEAVAAVLSKYTSDNAMHVSAFSDNFAYDATSNNRLSNPLFNSSTGAAGATSVGAGTTITATSIARDWTVQSAAGGTSTTVCTTPAAPDGYGNAQRLAITGTNATDEVLVRTGSIASARLATGDRLFGEAFVRVTSATNLRGVRIQWFYSVDGVPFNHTGMSIGVATMPYNQANMDLLVLRTPEFTVPPGALTSGQLSIAVRFAGAGGATVDVWRASLRNVN